MEGTLLERSIVILEGKPRGFWLKGIIISILFILLGSYSIYRTIYYGLGEWGLSGQISWGLGIVNFVWWVGLAHAGTFISAILLLLHQQWRSSINRAAEAMTIIAIICAAFYPIIHIGRVYFAYWMLPYPNTRELWINFHSPLVWDFFAIFTYFVVSVLFWLWGMIPDLAELKNKLQSPFKRNLYHFLSFFWFGTKKQWKEYFYLGKMIAALAAILVVSVHSIVSFDFAVSYLPGWHSLIFPIFFVVGAIFSGFALVQIMLSFLKSFLNLKEEIGLMEIKNINKIILICSCLMSLFYLSEIIAGFQSEIIHEKEMLLERLVGEYSLVFYFMIFLNILLPQFFWIKKIITNQRFSIIISSGILIGMWLERYLIVIGSLQTSSLGVNETSYQISLTEIGLFIGTIGIFILLFLLFIRLFPVISLHEKRTK